MNEQLAARCDELREIVLELTPLMIASQGSAKHLANALPVISRLRAVAEKGDAGIDSPQYQQWVQGSPSNIAALEDAARRGDAAAAWAAFADQEKGVNLLSTACSGYPGW